MIGFDIVDLQDAKSVTSEKLERKISKLLCGEEKHLFGSITEKSHFMWFIWSAKEGAYKALAEEGESFNPHKILIEAFDVEGHAFTASLKFKGQQLLARGYHDEEQECVTCTVLKVGDSFEKVSHRLFETGSRDIDSIREDLYRRVEKVADKDQTGASLMHMESGRPYLKKGDDQNLNISLSHHGRFAGFAYLPH